jgi:hypothetical protein
MYRLALLKLLLLLLGLSFSLLLYSSLSNTLASFPIPNPSLNLVIGVLNDSANL